MSSSAAVPQVSGRTKGRLAVTGRPSREDLVDAGFVLALGLLALSGFRTTFDSPRYLLAGGLGLLLGVAVAHIATTLKQHWLVLALMVVVTFFLFGGAVALSGDAIGGILPDGSVLRHLVELPVSGWKGLLTTLPPVDGNGQFLVLPYLLGLAVGSTTFAWARRARASLGPVLVPVALLATVILLGTLEPAALLVQGLGFTVIAFLWLAVRRRRALHVVGTGGGLRGQAGIGAALLAAALGVGWFLGGSLPGTDTPRTVLRTYVQPPFDITQYPSPLVGFRKYTEGAQKVWDQELFAVTGVPGGSLLRMAVLDDYSGTVWSAAGAASGARQTFHKVGSTIAPAAAQPTTTPERVTVTVGAAYAGLADAKVWVPSVGYPTTLTFGGPRAAALAESTRYNPDTGQAVVAAGFAAGDTVRMEAAPVPTVDQAFATGSGPTVSSDSSTVVAAKAVQWAQKKPTPWEQLQAVASTLKAGAYSDGTRTGETQYLPGHGVARTATFLGRPQLVGNDEQYASTFALMANSLGVPARVVMGAVVPEGGVVHGRDIHAWVELRGSDGRWHAVPAGTFMPDRDKVPEQQPRATAMDSNAANVPPPNSQRPPGSVDVTFDTTSAVVRPPTLIERLAALPPWIFTLLKVVGYPLLVLALVVGGLALARGLRRRRRKRRGTPSRRLAEGWRDYVDHARDLGIVVPAGLTRREHVALVGRADLAGRADSAVFGWGEPEQVEVARYWADVKAARKQLTKSVSRRRRVGRRFSLRGLLARDVRPVEALPKAQDHVGATPRSSVLRRPRLRKASA